MAVLQDTTRGHFRAEAIRGILTRSLAGLAGSAGSYRVLPVEPRRTSCDVTGRVLKPLVVMSKERFMRRAVTMFIAALLWSATALAQGGGAGTAGAPGGQGGRGAGRGPQGPQVVSPQVNSDRSV